MTMSSQDQSKTPLSPNPDRKYPLPPTQILTQIPTPTTSPTPELPTPNPQLLTQPNSQPSPSYPSQLTTHNSQPQTLALSRPAHI